MKLLGPHRVPLVEERAKGPQRRERVLETLVRKECCDVVITRSPSTAEICCQTPALSHGGSKCPSRAGTGSRETTWEEAVQGLCWPGRGKRHVRGWLVALSYLRGLDGATVEEELLHLLEVGPRRLAQFPTGCRCHALRPHNLHRRNAVLHLAHINLDALSRCTQHLALVLGPLRCRCPGLAIAAVGQPPLVVRSGGSRGGHVTAATVASVPAPRTAEQERTRAAHAAGTVHRLAAETLGDVLVLEEGVRRVLATQPARCAASAGGWVVLLLAAVPGEPLVDGRVALVLEVLEGVGCVVAPLGAAGPAGDALAATLVLRVRRAAAQGLLLLGKPGPLQAVHGAGALTWGRAVRHQAGHVLGLEQRGLARAGVVSREGLGQAGGKARRRREAPRGQRCHDWDLREEAPKVLPKSARFMYVQSIAQAGTRQHAVIASTNTFSTQLWTSSTYSCSN